MNSVDLKPYFFKSGKPLVYIDEKPSSKVMDTMPEVKPVGVYGCRLWSSIVNIPTPWIMCRICTDCVPTGTSKSVVSFVQLLAAFGSAMYWYWTEPSVM